MPYTTLHDLRARNPHNNALRKTHPSNGIKSNDSNWWISYFAVIGAVIYMILKSSLFASFIHSFNDSSYCIRNNDWMDDWDVISQWNGFVKDCSKNAPISNNDIIPNGFEGDNHIDFIEITRCVTSAYSVINYLCVSDDAAANRQSMFGVIKNIIGTQQEKMNKRNIKEIVLDEFIGTFKYLDPSYQTVYRLYMHQNFDKDAIGHVWVLQTLPNNTYNWYQSFIGQYTLRSWMNKEEQNSFVTRKELLKRMELIRMIITADMWSEQVNKAYLKLFDVDYSHLIGQHISTSIFGEGSGYDNTIHFDWSVACYMNRTDDQLTYE